MPTLLELERIASRGWQGTIVEPLGDWLLRAGGGFTGRANSVLALGSPGVTLDDALARVEEFYRRVSLPAMFQIPFLDDDPLGGALTGRGWQSFNRSSFLVAPLASALNAFPARDVGTAIFEPTPSRIWLAGYHYRGRPLPPNAVEVLVNADGPVFLRLMRGEELLGVARGIVTDGWLGVTAVTVPEPGRRRGVGSALMASLLRWAADRGAHSAYLQVDAGNDGALAMYRRGGFVEHHRYHYLRQV